MCTSLSCYRYSGFRGFGGGGRFRAKHVLQNLCLCSELRCPEKSSCTHFVATPRAWLLVPVCVSFIWAKIVMKIVVCGCGARCALFCIFSGNKLCTILSFRLSGFGPMFYRFVPDSVEMPCFIV